MSGIKYYALRTGEEPPMEFVAIRHVDGEPEFVASYVNSSYLSYENGVLLKMHERNDALRAENAKLRELVKALLTCATDGDCDECRLNGATPWHVGKAQLCDGVWDRMRELGVEVDDD